MVQLSNSSCMFSQFKGHLHPMIGSQKTALISWSNFYPSGKCFNIHIHTYTYRTWGGKPTVVASVNYNENSEKKEDRKSFWAIYQVSNIWKYLARVETLLPCAHMREGVKQSVLSVCQFVCLSVKNFEIYNVNIDRVKRFPKLTESLTL